MHTCTHTSMHTHKHKPVLWHNNQLCFRKMFSSVNQTKEEINCLGKRRKKKKKEEEALESIHREWAMNFYRLQRSMQLLQKTDQCGLTSEYLTLISPFLPRRDPFLVHYTKYSAPHTPPKLQQLSKCPIIYRIHSATPNFLELLITIVSQETLPVKSVTHALPLRHKQRESFLSTRNLLTRISY